jgi:hypothetical protein
MDVVEKQYFFLSPIFLEKKNENLLALLISPSR